VQEVRWDGGGIKPVGEYTFLYRKGNMNHELGSVFFVHKRFISAIKSLEFVSDRMSYITLRGCWCNIIVLNVHAPTQDKIDGVKDSFYEELGSVFGEFPKYNMKILLDFFGKVGKEDIFQPIIENGSLPEINNENENITAKSTMFPYCNIHKFTRITHDGKPQSD
jgi:hypothetical protein